MAHICAVVLNSVSRDARVLKEAASLRAEGHQVTLIGVTDKNFGALAESLPNGVEIKRVNIQRAREIFNNITQSIGLLFAAILLFVAILHPELFSLLLLPIFLLTSWFAITSLRYIFKDTSQRQSIPTELRVGGVVGLARGILKRLKKPRDFLIRSIWMWVRVIPVMRAVRKLSPDVIHCHDIHTLLIGVYVKNRTGCKMIYDAHEIYEEVPHINRIEKLYCKFIHNVVKRRLDGFITINESIAQWYADHYPTFPPAIIIMNATPKLDVPHDDGRLRAAANVPTGKQILLYQGGYAKHRGLPYLLEAAAHLPADWVLVMMGWGAFEPELRNIAARVNDARGEEVIRFIPPAPQAELAAWTAGGTIGVIPYENTGLNHWLCTPNKLWEYPNAAVPVLVSPFPELRKPVEQYGYGWLLPESQDPAELGAMIAKLTPAEIATAKANCMTFLDANHWGIYSERLVTAYRNWLQGRPA